MPGYRWVGGREVSGNTRGRQGRGQKMTLHKITTQSAQALHLVSALDPLGYDLEPQTVGQRDDGLNDGVSPVGVGYPFDEGAVA